MYVRTCFSTLVHDKISNLQTFMSVCLKDLGTCNNSCGRHRRTDTKTRTCNNSCGRHRRTDTKTRRHTGTRRHTYTQTCRPTSMYTRDSQTNACMNAAYIQTHTTLMQKYEHTVIASSLSRARFIFFAPLPSLAHSLNGVLPHTHSLTQFLSLSLSLSLSLHTCLFPSLLSLTHSFSRMLSLSPHPPLSLFLSRSEALSRACARTYRLSDSVSQKH